VTEAPIFRVAPAATTARRRPGTWHDPGMDLELTGKRAVVTGGNRGIGLAVARALAAEGCDVALVARDKAALDAARAPLAAASGRTVLALPCDTGDDESVAAMATAVIEGLRGADILVNAAARANSGAVVGIDGFDAAEFGEQVNVKVLGYLRCVRAFVPQMRAAGWGRIINISGLAARSSGAITGTVRNVAVAAMTKNLADELGKDGINVNVVHPGVTVTEKTPANLVERAGRAGVTTAEIERRLSAGISIGRLVTAAEVANVVAFLASPKSVAVNGDAIAVGGGMIGPVYY